MAPTISTGASCCLLCPAPGLPGQEQKVGSAKPPLLQLPCGGCQPLDTSLPSPHLPGQCPRDGVLPGAKLAPHPWKDLSASLTLAFLWLSCTGGAASHPPCSLSCQLAAEPFEGLSQLLTWKGASGVCWAP